MKQILLFALLVSCKLVVYGQRADTALIKHYFYRGTLSNIRNSDDRNIINQLAKNRNANIRWLLTYFEQGNTEDEIQDATGLLMDLEREASNRMQREIINFTTRFIMARKNSMYAHAHAVIRNCRDVSFSKKAKNRIVNAINSDPATAADFLGFAPRLKLKKAIPGIKVIWKSSLGIPEIDVFNVVYAEALAHLGDEEAWNYLLKNKILVALKSDYDSDYRGVGLDILGNIATTEALKVLINELDNEGLVQDRRGRGKKFFFSHKNVCAARCIASCLTAEDKKEAGLCNDSFRDEENHYDSKEKVKKWIKSKDIDKIKLISLRFKSI
jgi:hypothetical protein